MGTASASTQSWIRRCGIALIAIGAGVLLPGHVRAAGAESAALLSPGLGCGPAEDVLGTSLLERVRDARRTPKRRQAAKPRPALPAPTPLVEDPAHLMRAFYTCMGSTVAPVPVGAGWVAVGPVRRG